MLTCDHLSPVRGAGAFLEIPAGPFTLVSGGGFRTQGPAPDRTRAGRAARNVSPRITGHKPVPAGTRAGHSGNGVLGSALVRERCGRGGEVPACIG